MSKKILQVKGYYKSIDTNYKKLTLLFLDDEIDDTRNILQRFYSDKHNNPIRHNEFTVKFDTKSKCFIDKSDMSQVPLLDLVDQTVILQVYIKHYNFTDKTGKKISGWNINLIKMNPSNYS